MTDLPTLTLADLDEAERSIRAGDGLYTGTESALIALARRALTPPAGAGEMPVVHADGTYEPPKDGWVCFHCGERFRTVWYAQQHFGASPDRKPGCLVRVQFGNEKGLEIALREAEAEIEKLRAPSSEDDVERVARAIYEAHHKGLLDCWEWDSSGLDSEHPGARDQYLNDARAALAAMPPAQGWRPIASAPAEVKS